MLDMHSEAWWIKALDGKLSPAEQVDWERHLSECSRCRAEWSALSQLEMVLRSVPALVPPAGLAQKATMMAVTARRQRRLWMLLGISCLTVLLVVGALVALGTAYWDFSHLLSAIVFSKDVLLQALVRTFVGLTVVGRSFSPLVLASAGVVLLLCMPHGFLATVTVVMLRRQRDMAPAAFYQARSVNAQRHGEEFYGGH